MGMYSFLYMFFKVILTTEALDNRNKNKLTSDKEKGKSKLFGLGNKDKLTSDKEKGKSKLFGLGGSKKSSLFGLGGNKKSYLFGLGKKDNNLTYKKEDEEK